MASFLVTGGAGFIGSHIAERLVSLGHKVRVLDDLETGNKDNLKDIENAIEFVEGSVLNEFTVEKAVEGMDYVLHQAALSSVQLSIDKPTLVNDVNVRGTLNVLESSRRAGVKKVVYASSASVYGGNPTPQKEDMPVDPLSPYAVSKAIGEMYCKLYSGAFDLDTVVLRYFNVFGPKQSLTSGYAAVIPKFIEMMGAGKRPTIFGDGEQTRDFTHVDNVVEANILAATSEVGSGEIFNITCGSSMSVNDLVEKLNVIFDSNLEPEYLPAKSGEVKHSLADVNKAKELLGFEPKVSVNEGLRRTCEWYMGAGSK